LAEPDLRALQIHEDRDGSPRVLCGATHVRVVVVVDGVVAVAEVQSRDVHPRIDEGPHGLIRRGRGSECGDDLGTSQSCVSECSRGMDVAATLPAPAYAGWRPIARSVGRTGAGSTVSPIRYRSTPAAAARP